MSDKISVIVPIYNVEIYLERCVESIMSQSHRNLEIILVDDGSPDNCPKICDDYAKKDSRIKVIHKKNGGLSDARNAGMKVATGDYISFIDSDDYISTDYLETLYQVLLKENSDIVECEIVKFKENEIPVSVGNLDIESFDAEKGLQLLIEEKVFHQYVWNKLYKADLALEVDFEKGKLNEDEFWTYQVFGKAKKVTKIQKAMYYYLQRNGSIMGTNYTFKRLDALEGKFNRQAYIENNYPNLSLCSKIDFYNSCIFACQSVLKFMPKDEQKKAIKVIKNYKKNCNLSFSDIKTVKNSSKKYFYFSKFNFYLCCKFRAITGIGF